jgi:hypothetical protein
MARVARRAAAGHFDAGVLQRLHRLSRLVRFYQIGGNLTIIPPTQAEIDCPIWSAKNFCKKSLPTLRVFGSANRLTGEPRKMWE